ncbi:formate dehydrogenase, partial [bacterium]
NNPGITAADVHIATFGTGSDGFFIVSGTDKGEELLKSAGLKADTDTTSWAKETADLIEKRTKARTTATAKIKKETGGLTNFAETLAKCISCHNCMRVCPICYCRRCYFESDVTEYSPKQYIERAKQKGSVRFSPDILLFHIGRMSHMTTSCVSCGTCEDACPVDIPVAQLFSTVADDAQSVFDYVAGMKPDEPLPLRIFIKEKELDEIERICKDPLAKSHK